jgi:uncharacterized protein (UPF0261 family)
MGCRILGHAEYSPNYQRLLEHGVDVLLVDAGVNEPSIVPDIPRTELASGVEFGDRGAAVTAMAEGAERVVLQLHAEGRLDGILALGGSGGSSIATRAMRALPVGVPKLMVSTVASGDTRPYVGAVDVTMMYSVVDIAGVNRVSARIMANAAGAIAGMVGANVPQLADKPLIGASMFGVTTPCVTRARERLEELGYEVLVFHATGTGGQSMEALAKAGFLAGVLDVTTTELADELVGGVLSAGPDRLEAAGALGLPQVVSLGALDMVNFGPRETVPTEFAGRKLYVHNPTVTLTLNTGTFANGSTTATAAGCMAQCAMTAAARIRVANMRCHSSAYSRRAAAKSRAVVSACARAKPDCRAMLIPSATTGCASPAAFPAKNTPSRQVARMPGRMGPAERHSDSGVAPSRA